MLASLDRAASSSWALWACGLLCLAAALIGAWNHAVAVPLYGAAVALGAWPLARGALRARSLDMNVLMSASALGACVLGDWSEAAALVVLFGLAERLESRSQKHARQSIASLLSLAPPRVLVRCSGGGEMEEVEASQVRVGAAFTVRAGERVALDGVALSAASLDESPVTGEAMPVEKREGDQVLAGTLNVGGPFEARATRLAHEGTSARIARLVSEAQARTSPRQRAVEKFARFYTPAVFATAVVVAVAPPLVASASWQASAYRALALLVAACPCAFVLSGPVATWCALASLSRRGVLVRGGEALESLAEARVFAFDKTGTLSRGAPTVCGVVRLPLADLSRDELVAIAAGLEARSTHPLSRAVRAWAREKSIEAAQVLEADEARGLGVSGRVDGVLYRFERLSDATLQEPGNSQPWDAETQRAIAEAAGAMHARGHSVALLSRESTNGQSEPLALWSFADEVRADAREALARLEAMGVRERVVLSGDNEAAVARVAREVGATAWRSGLRPEQKQSEVRALEERHRTLAMVGDGINDAPALASASVGVAVGARGASTCGASRGASDIALEASGVALLRDDLCALPEAVSLARRARGIIRGNIVLSLSLKGGFVLGVLAGAWGQHYLVGGVIADVGASLLVTLIGLRLLRIA